MTALSRLQLFSLPPPPSHSRTHLPCTASSKPGSTALLWDWPQSLVGKADARSNVWASRSLRKYYDWKLFLKHPSVGIRRGVRHNLFHSQRIRMSQLTCGPPDAAQAVKGKAGPQNLGCWLSVDCDCVVPGTWVLESKGSPGGLSAAWPWI